MNLKKGNVLCQELISIGGRQEKGGEKRERLVVLIKFHCIFSKKKKKKERRNQKRGQKDKER